jgi:hypothetical protein
MVILPMWGIAAMIWKRSSCSPGVNPTTSRAACKLGWACFGRYGMNKPTINASTSLLLLLRYSQSSTPPPRSKFSDNKKEA